jgi:hypothetical protein
MTVETVIVPVMPPMPESEIFVLLGENHILVLIEL